MEIDQLYGDIMSLDKGLKTSLKRSLGLKFSSANIPMNTRFFIFAHSPGNADRDCLQAIFFCSCVIANSNESNTVKIQDYLKKLYNAPHSESEKVRIERLLEDKAVENGSFYPTLARFIEQAIHQNISINGISLLKDLMQWNDGSKKIQIKWAKAISYTEKKEDN